MDGCSLVSATPNRPNIFYAVLRHTTAEDDFVNDIKMNSINAGCAIVYCQSLNVCADLYAYFQYMLGNKGY